MTDPHCPQPDAACATDTCAPDTCTPAGLPARPRKRLRDIFASCASCAGGTAGGMLLGHAGCIAAPLAMAALGISGAAIGGTVLAAGFAAAATAGGLFAWHKLRGQQAGKWEKRIVIAGSLAGIFATVAMHHTAHSGHHAQHAPNAIEIPLSCCGESCPKTLLIN